MQSRRAERIIQFVQVLFFAALAVVVAATVVPAPEMPVTVTWNDKLLHFVAYFGLGILGGSGWENRRAFLLLLMPVFGLGLEFVQGAFIPGRAFDWYDAVANAAGAFAGVASSLRLSRLLVAFS